MVLTSSEKEGAPRKAVDQFVKAGSVYQKLCSMAKPGRVVELWLSRSHFKKLAVSQLSSLLCVEQPCVPEAVQPVVRERTQVALMSTGVEELVFYVLSQLAHDEFSIFSDHQTQSTSVAASNGIHRPNADWAQTCCHSLRHLQYRQSVLPLIQLRRRILRALHLSASQCTWHTSSQRACTNSGMARSIHSGGHLIWQQIQPARLQSHAIRSVIMDH